MSIGERMRERRKSLGLSAEDVAEQLGMSPATIYRYEKGDIEKVPGDKLIPIAQILSVSPAWLMGWTDDSAPFSDPFASETLSAEDEEFISLFRKLEPDARRMLLAQIRGLLSD